MTATIFSGHEKPVLFFPLLLCIYALLGCPTPDVENVGDAATDAGQTQTGTPDAGSSLQDAGMPLDAVCSVVMSVSLSSG